MAMDVTRLTISPPHSLLVVAGVGAMDTPIPDGTSTVVASPDTILVMTQYEHLRSTEISVAIQPGSEWPSPGLRQVFEGDLQSPGGIVELRNVLLEPYGRFSLGSDSDRIRVAVDIEIEPDRIDIAIEPIRSRVTFADAD
jgi:hypothetical protein